MSITCRCPLCGAKNAGSNRTTNSYHAVGIGRDEHGRDWDGLTKREARKLRRTRERRAWKSEISA